MSILHLSSKRRSERTTVSITTDHVFAHPKATPLLAAQLSRASSTSTLLSCVSSLQSLCSTPPPRHDSEPASPVSSLSDSFHLPSPTFPPLTSKNAPPLPRANARRTSTHNKSTKPQLTKRSATGAMSHKTMDERSSESRFDDDQTRLSGISGLSLLSSDPDDFYQRSLDHLRRDRHRLRDAANHSQPFRRARPTNLTMDGLDRRKAASDSSVISEEPAPQLSRRQSAAAASLERSNVPKDWGRRGKHTNDFLRRINSTGDIDEDAQENQNRAAAEQGSPLSSRERPSRIGRPGPRVKRSIDDLMDRQKRRPEDSSESASPLASGIPRQSASPSSQREIDSVKGRAVASSRLADAGAGRSIRAPGSFAAAFKRTEESVEGTMDSILGQLNGDPEKSPRRVEHSAEPQESRAKENQERDKRNKSRDLLRRFARASASPAPAPAPKLEPLTTQDLADSRNGSVDQSPVSPSKTPPRNINALRASVYGALGSSEPASPSARSSPSISKVPTRTSSLRSLRPSKKKSHRASQGRSSDLPTPSEDIPIASIEEPLESVRLDERDMLPTVQEPTPPRSEHPDPLRSNPVSPEPEEGKPLFTTIVEKSSKLLNGYGFVIGDSVATAPTAQSREKVSHARRLASDSEEDLDIDDDTLEIVAGLGTGSQVPRELLPDEQQAFARMAQRIRQRRSQPGHDRKTAPIQQETKTEAPFQLRTSDREVPTLWDVTAATALGALSALWIFFAQQDSRGRWKPRPRFWVIVGTLTWLWLETSLCRRFCPHYCRVWFPSYTDMHIRGPRFPFVTTWKLVLEPTERAWRPVYEATRAFAEPRGWGLLKRSLWWSLKRVRLDWLFGPGDERLEGRWDWPWWWSYLYGAEWGIMDPYCVMCAAPGPRATGRVV